MIDLWRIRFKDGIRAADSRLVWATTKEAAEALGEAYCLPRGFRLVCAEIETVGREGEAVEPPAEPKIAQPIAPIKLPPPTYAKP